MPCTDLEATSEPTRDSGRGPRERASFAANRRERGRGLLRVFGPHRKTRVSTGRGCEVFECGLAEFSQSRPNPLDQISQRLYAGRAGPPGSVRAKSTLFQGTRPLFAGTSRRRDPGGQQTCVKAWIWSRGWPDREIEQSHSQEDPLHPALIRQGVRGASKRQKDSEARRKGRLRLRGLGASEKNWRASRERAIEGG